MAKKTKKIWIDLDNSPHIPFFNPIIQELQKKNYEVLITVRDYAQAIGLADYFQFDYRPLGKHFGKNKLLKTLGVLFRAMQMLPVFIRERPDLALSHGSRSQFLFASLAGMKCVVATDYEHSAEFPLLVPTLGIVPEVMPESFTKKYFKKVARFPGIKEDVYKQNLQPDPSILSYLNIHENHIVVSVRPPATAAHYHTELSDRLFQMTMEHVLANEHTKLIILPRTTEQQADIEKKYRKYLGSGKIIIPGKVLDGLNLVWHSDLVISGGGTMIRESAALGVPAYSIFGGKIGAVDHYLETSGRLFLIRSEEDIQHKVMLKKSEKKADTLKGQSPALQKIVEEVINLVEA